MGVYIYLPPALCLGPSPRLWPQFVFTGPDPQFVFTGHDPQFVFTGHDP